MSQSEKTPIEELLFIIDYMKRVREAAKRDLARSEEDGNEALAIISRDILAQTEGLE